MTLTEKARDILEDMLGAREHVAATNRGYRNHYAAARGSVEENTLVALLEQGLVTRGHESHVIAMFHATEAGCRAAGLTAAETARALEV